MNVSKTTILESVAICAIVLLAACQPANQSAVLSPDADVSSQMQQGQQQLQQASNSGGQQNGQSGRQLVNVVEPLQQRIILKDASLQLVVDNVTATLDTITKMAEDMGGWVINSSTTKISRATGDDAITGDLSIRVPSAQLTVALTQIKALSTSVDAETINGRDVTQEYVDLNSQLTNLQAAEKQLQIILDAATTSDDVLKIYNELVRVRGEIETTQGRINYFKEASSFSSINISLRPPTVPQASVQVDTAWSPETTVKGAFNALLNILQGLANLLITIVVLVIPLVLVVVIPIWLIYKLLRRYGRINQRNRAAKISEPPSTTKVENDVG